MMEKKRKRKGREERERRVIYEWGNGWEEREAGRERWEKEEG